MDRLFTQWEMIQAMQKAFDRGWDEGKSKAWYAFTSLTNEQALDIIDTLIPKWEADDER